MSCSLPPCRKTATNNVPVSENVSLNVCRNCMLTILTSRVHFGQCCAPSCTKQIIYVVKLYYTPIIGACMQHCDGSTEIGKLFVEIKTAVDNRNYDDIKQRRVTRVNPDLLKAAVALKLDNPICLHRRCRMLANWCAEKMAPPIVCNFHKPPDFILYRTKLGARRSNSLLVRLRSTDSINLRLRKIKVKRGHNICMMIKKNTVSMVQNLFKLPLRSDVAIDQSLVS